jgi:hypothetical protein
MEIATTMSSPSQMPQALAETNPADETGGIQGKAAQSTSFGLFFDHWAGIAVGKKLSVDSGNNKFTQSPLQGESPTEPATGGAKRIDLSQGPLPKISVSYVSGMFTMAMAAPDKNVQKMPEQTLANSRASDPENEVNSAAGPTLEEMSVPLISTLQILPGLQQKIGKVVITGGITTDTFGESRSVGARNVQIPSENPTALYTSPGLPVLMAKGDHSADSAPSEKPSEATEEKGETDSDWTPLFTVGNLLGEGDFATSLPMSAGPVQQQGNAQPENNAEQSVTQPGVLQAAVGGATGTFFQGPAISLPVKTTDSLPASVTSLRASILGKADHFQDTLPGIEAPPGNFGRTTGSAMKKGGDAVMPEAKGDIEANRDILFSRTKGKIGESVDISRPEADISSREAVQATRIQSRMGIETAGNAYRAVAADTVLPGENDVSSMSGNVTQGKPPAIPDSTTANAGMDLSRLEIVFAADERENLKEPGDVVTRKSGEGKTTDSTSTPAFVTNPAELRTTGESRIATTPLPDAKNPLGEHINNQIREKLDASGHGSNNGQITLKLHPEELGELKINMRMVDQHLKIEIITQNPSVKEALMQNLDTLKETLSRQNIAMDRFDVSADLRQGLHQGGRDGRQMTQDNRVINTGFQLAAALDGDAAPNLQYSWESENSLVNLML